MKFKYILILLLSQTVVWGQPVSDRLFDIQMENLAEQFVNLSATDQAFNQFVKGETGKRFDGDYNFLLNPILDSPLINGESLKKKLMGIGDIGTELVLFIQQHPRIQLAIPVNWNSWSGRSGLPVCWIPSNYSEESTVTVPCFQENGSRDSLSTLVEPIFPVMVLGINERTDPNGRLIPSYRDGGLGGSPVDDDDDDWDDFPPCYGPDGGWQYLESIYCTNLMAIEHWVAGTPEIQFIFKREDDLSLINGQWGAIIEPPDRSDVDEAWYELDATLFRWFQETTSGIAGIGSYCFVFMNERDNGDLIDLPINVTVTTPAGVAIGVQLNVKITDKDEIIGTLPTYFIDCDHFVYHPGLLKFKMFRQ